MLEDMPDRVPRVIEVAGDLPDGHAIATRPPNGAVVVHRKHVLDLRASEWLLWESSQYTEAARVGPS